MWTYITEQRDSWDALALDIYGTEKLAHLIVQANQRYRHLLYLPAGITLNIPPTPEQVSRLPKPPWEV